jgi:hypothetical protein
MSMSYIFVLLMALTLMTAIRRQAPANIERYLWWFLIEIPIGWAVHSWYGDWSPIYAFTYCLFDGIILLCACRIAIDCLRTRRYRLRAAALVLILALAVTRTVFLEAVQPLDRFLVISLVEGFVLVWAGTLALFAGAYTKYPGLYCALGVFWLCQAWYSLGWVMDWKALEEFNWLIPPATGFLCFSWLAWRLKTRCSSLGA